MQQQPLPVEQALGNAIGHHRAGDSALASYYYAEVLKREPNHPDALRLSSLLGTACPAALLRAHEPVSHIAALAALRALLAPRNYVEIGVRGGETLVSGNGAESLVGIGEGFELRVPVAQNLKLFRSSSDEFFARRDLARELDGEPVDTAFIDGTHVFEYALRDFIHIERCCARGSVLFLHNVHPDRPEEAVRDGAPLVSARKPWRGDVWKLVPALAKHRPDLALLPLRDVHGGLLAVAGLDPANRTLEASYDAIVAEYVPIDFAAARIDLYGRFVSLRDEAASDFFASLLLARNAASGVDGARERARAALAGIARAGAPRANVPAAASFAAASPSAAPAPAEPAATPSLRALGERHGTDKAPHGFCDHYERAFSAMRPRVTKMLEVGVFFGASLRMWRDWFPNATIHGADHFTGMQGNGKIFENADRFVREVAAGSEPRIVLHQLDQADRAALEGFAAAHLHGTFDLVIDDASHLMRDQQQTLGALFRLVRPGGYFVIEDTHSSICPDYDVDPDGGNSTLRMIETALAGGGFRSRYMTKEETDFLDATVDLSAVKLCGAGGSQTCILRRRMEAARPLPAAARAKGSVVIVNYATDDPLNRARQQRNIAWAKEYVREALERSGGPVTAADVVCLGPDALDSSFRERNAALLAQPRGGGYWLWKPCAIAAMLEATNAEYVVYCDSGSLLKKPLAEVVGTLSASGAAVLAFEMSSFGRIESQWTKGQVLRAMGADGPGLAGSAQLGATASAWRTGGTASGLAREWLRLMEDPAFSTDAPSADGAGDLPGFLEHRHDQSVYSVLLKKRLAEGRDVPPAVVLRDFAGWVGHHEITREAMREAEAPQAPAVPVSAPAPPAGSPGEGFVALFNLGVAAYGRNDFASALSAFDRAAQARPDFALAWYNLGLTAAKLDRRADALACLDRAVALDPSYAPAVAVRDALRGVAPQAVPSVAAPPSPPKPPDYAERLNRAITLQQQGKLDEAEEIFRALLDLDPRDLPALFSLGGIHHARGNPDLAIEFLLRARDASPSYAPVHYNLGVVYQSLRRNEESLACYDRALELQPDYVEVRVNRGGVLVELKRHKDALLNYEELLRIDPANDKALCNRGILLTDFKMHDLAIATYERLLEVNPRHEYAPGLLAFAKMHACDWKGLPAIFSRILEGVRAGERVSRTLPLTAITDDPRDHLHGARIFARHFFPERAPMWRGEIRRHDRIRVAYVSPDFREHPVGHLTAGMFEAHDRSRFEVTGISLGIDDGSPLRARIAASFDAFVDARGMTSRDIASLLHDRETDLLVDLAGYTADSRSDLFAYRPAPMQAIYLGYSSTMGAPYYDYLLVDRHVVPEEFRDAYEEKSVWIPETYMPTDSSLRIPEQAPPRERYGLPPAGFVFCSFNHDYKIAPPVFDIWMRLLAAVPGSVLWLMKLNDSAERNLRAEAAARGVDPARVIFATRVPSIEEHLARYRIPDLFLDTFPCNAHSTTSDVLRAGLPVVTCRGRAFASRVAAGLLAVAGMEELVTDSLEEYERLALKLATDGTSLPRLRKKLAANLKTLNPFDTVRHCRGLERAYEAMHDRYLRGLPSGHIDPDLPPAGGTKPPKGAKPARSAKAGTSAKSGGKRK